MSGAPTPALPPSVRGRCSWVILVPRRRGLTRFLQQQAELGSQHWLDPQVDQCVPSPPGPPCSPGWPASSLSPQCCPLLLAPTVPASLSTDVPCPAYLHLRPGEQKAFCILSGSLAPGPCLLPHNQPYAPPGRTPRKASLSFLLCTWEPWGGCPWFCVTSEPLRVDPYDPMSWRWLLGSVFTLRTRRTWPPGTRVPL